MAGTLSRRIAALLWVGVILGGLHPSSQAAEPQRHVGHRATHRRPTHHAPARRPTGAPKPHAPKPVTNANSPKQPVETIEAVETVEPVEAVPNLADPAAAATAPVPTAASVPPSLWLKTVGRLHAASVHLPIAWTLLWVLAEVVAPAIGAAPLATAALPLGVVTCLSFAPSMATGWLRLGELSLQPGYDVADGIFHRNIMLVAGAVLTVALLLRLLWAFFPARLLRSLYVVVLLAGMALVGFGAHLGGRLVYGDDFLPF